ncbi:molybdate ABC transporter substrate-binding protein [Alteromonas sp. M12]|uniref:molybdate ABC transporter substrate-binding protein n=1 Tax=Alteromonas sp. M12 TaxID=3135644 RepID=UPI00319E7446
MVRFYLGKVFLLNPMQKLKQRYTGKLVRVLCGVLFLFYLHSAAANQVIHVAVASNFLSTLKQLKSEFERTHNSKVLISAASTGKLYAQISHGAPFDIFFSADDVRPQQLEALGFSKHHKAFTYAYGKLVVFHPSIESTQFSLSQLANNRVEHIAIANPKLAPYGLAAKNWLLSKGIWQAVSDKIVMGENINQAMQFVKSGNAQVAIVALSMMKEEPISAFSELLTTDYQPIRQQGILLSNNKNTAQFAAFLFTEPAQTIIQQNGYILP